MKNRAELEELISIYALGALDGEELQEAEGLLASSPEAQELFREYQDVTSYLPYASKGLMPDPALRRRIVDEILAAREYPTEEAPPPFWKRFQQLGLTLGGAVAVGLILFLFISNQSLNQKLGVENTRISELGEKITDQESIINSLKSVIAEKESEIGDLKQVYANLDELTEFLEDPNVVVIQLSNMHSNPDAGGGVLWDKDDNEALFYCLDLQNAPEGKTYQWWVKADGVHKSIAVFKVDGKGSSVIRLKSLSDLGEIEKYSVTLETAGGADQPTGKMYFAGDHRGSSL
ncbi:MAG: anti-sigma factor [Deltaproteobacteria bacterium]|nr:anti-sigma factor [Deltaproteobacteria bacterium]MCK5709878.1 anti-sigma factor [Deltaproteobacteria bacterium]